MTRLPPTPSTLRALFAKSGNVCAFPGCTQELITKGNTFVAQVCHIEAAETGGERYNPASNDEDRRSVENLIVLCYPHHIETNDVTGYPATKLKEMKRLHEAKCGLKDFKIDESALYQIEHQMEMFWDHVVQINVKQHVAQEFAVPIQKKSSPEEIFADIWSAYYRIEELTELLHKCDLKLNRDIRQHLYKLGYDLTAYDAVLYHENPFENRLWEIHNLAFPNNFTDLNMAIRLSELRYLQEYVKTHPGDTAAFQRLADAKVELEKIADKISYLD